MGLPRLFILGAVICIGLLAAKKQPASPIQPGEPENSSISLIRLTGEAPGQPLEQDLNDGEIRVVIRTQDYQSIYHDTVEIDCKGGFAVLDETDGTTQEYGAEDTLFIVHEEEGKSGRKRIVPADSGRLVVRSLPRNEKFGGFRGELECIDTPEGIVLINSLKMEEYLYGVVPGEMPSSYPKEALKAQAVCARSYAYDKILHPGYPDYEAHLDDSTFFQVYATTPEQASTCQAVDETRDMICADKDGQVLETWYYSTSMGNGRGCVLKKSMLEHEELYEVYVNNLKEEDVFREYIFREDEDDLEHEESLYRWTYTVETSTLPKELYQSLLQQKNAVPEELKPFKRVYDIAVSERGQAGVVYTIAIVTDSGTYHVRGESAARKVLFSQDGKLVDHLGKEWNSLNMLPSGFFAIDTSVKQENVIGYSLCGGGFGHGRGMSQNGAKELAKLGYTCKEILEFFYDKEKL